MKRWACVSAQWPMGGPRGPRCVHTLAVSASGFPLWLWFGCFQLDITAASVSPASLRALGCLSHCGASSLAGARLCCSVSTRGSACTRLWAAQTGGNLGTKQRVINRNKVIKDRNTDVKENRHKEDTLHTHCFTLLEKIQLT